MQLMHQYAALSALGYAIRITYAQQYRKTEKLQLTDDTLTTLL